MVRAPAKRWWRRSRKEERWFSARLSRVWCHSKTEETTLDSWYSPAWWWSGGERVGFRRRLSSFRAPANRGVSVESSGGCASRLRSSRDGRRVSHWCAISLHVSHFSASLTRIPGKPCGFFWLGRRPSFFLFGLWPFYLVALVVVGLFVLFWYLCTVGLGRLGLDLLIINITI